MIKVPFAFYLIVFLFLPFSSISQQQIKTDKIPAWIEVIDYDKEVSDTIHAGGSYDLLTERQYNVHLKESYFRTSIKVLTEQGLESSSYIRVNYDPAYQSLVFHSVSVIRGEQVINKLVKNRFEVLRREENLERSVYDKSLDAVMNLDDIQVGDIIEYAYSIKGYNPVFNDKFFKTIYFNYSVPVGKLFTKIISPTERPLYFKSFNNAKEPIKEQNKNLTTYTWNRDKISALLTEDKIPNWFDPYDNIEVTEYDSWNSVCAWAVPLYSTKSVSSTAIDKKIEEIKNSNNTIEKQINACIQFVQDEIRYLAFSGGIQGYKPHSPALVFNQRFGDCKDKSLLLSFMLQKLGVKSYPALVNTNMGKSLTQSLPSPVLFDHCIVQFILQDSTHWIDPTITLQRGTIKSKSIPSYYNALVISDKKETLVTITPDANRANILVQEDFTLESVGGSARLNVETKYFGSEANYMRSNWKSSSAAETKKNYTNFYANDYPDIQMDKNVEFIDDEEHNVLTTIEKYSINKFWKLDSLTNKYSADFYPRVLANYLTSPDTKKRLMPYVLTHPVSIDHRIVIHLPEVWNVNETSKEIISKGFEYTSKISYDKSKEITLHYTYKSLEGFLKASDVQSHLQKVEAALGDLSFQITYAADTGKASEPNIPFIIISLFVAFGIVVILKKLYKYDPRAMDYQFAYDNLGGWMILPLLGLFFTPFRTLYEIYDGEYFNYINWRILTDPGFTSYNPMLGLIILVELLYNIVILGYSILLIILLLKQRTSFPLLICSLYGLNLTFLLFENAWLHIIDLPESYKIPDQGLDIARTVISVAVWIPFFLKADRVKGTFRERLS
ncbi:MAG TPA: DUF3857 domain-containing protein [Cyclobacteriaceae bacterium]|jgi:transglutaminase-like putative cysteine protease|nr:DUF3857 domain-containing protein [Cyclobacteriaceae bacterium]